jgi:hypothetical protein
VPLDEAELRDDPLVGDRDFGRAHADPRPDEEDEAHDEDEREDSEEDEPERRPPGDPAAMDDALALDQ